MKEQLISIIKTAGKLMLSKRDFSIEEKTGHANFVTTVDKSVQDYIEAQLLLLLPDSRIIAEEKENSLLTNAPTWVIDPIDGTTNFIHDYHQSCISIALLVDKSPVIGLIYQPYSDELFCAEKGEGAFLNGRRIHCSENTYPRALVSVGTSPYNPELSKKSLSLALTYLNECSDIRRTGSAAIDLANLSCGRTDIYFEMILKPWDFAAGALLVTEAGGIFDMPLSKTGIDFSVPQAILASNRVCYQQAVERFMNT